MKIVSLKRVGALGARAGITLTCLWPAAASSQSAADFFAGKAITLNIGFNPGGGYDIYARLAATHLPRFIPGHPTIIPKNMPGIASLKAASYMAGQAPRDGTAIAMLDQAVAVEQVLQNPAAQYDVRQFNWVGRMTPVVQFIVAWHTSPVKTIEDAKHNEIILAATSATGVTAIVPRLLDRLGGTKFKVIVGYPGTAGSLLAMERGEVQGATVNSGDLLDRRANWVREKKIAILVQYSNERSQAFKDIPAIGELGRTTEEKQILGLYGSAAELGRALMAPPEVPPARMEILRHGFDTMVTDPAFLADVSRLKLELEPMTGENLQGMVQGTFDIAPLVRAKAASLIKEISSEH